MAAPKTLRQLEHERVTQKRRLEEEQKQFAFVMSRRLRPRNIQASASTITSASISARRPARCTRSAPPALSTQRHEARGRSWEPRDATHGQCEMMTHLCHLTRSLHMCSEDSTKPMATDVSLALYITHCEVMKLLKESLKESYTAITSKSCPRSSSQVHTALSRKTQTSQK